MKWQTKLITKLQIQLSAFVSHRSSLLKDKDYLYYLTHHLSHHLFVIILDVVVDAEHIDVGVDVQALIDLSAWDHCALALLSFMSLSFTADPSMNHNYLFQIQK